MTTATIHIFDVKVDAAAELQRKGFVVRHNYVGSGQGSVCRVVEFAPGGAKFMRAQEPMVCRLTAGGEWIRTSGSAMRSLIANRAALVAAA